VGTAYNQAISTKGGAEPIIFDVVAGAAPGGLTLNAATGVLSGDRQQRLRWVASVPDHRQLNQLHFAQQQPSFIDRSAAICRWNGAEHQTKGVFICVQFKLQSHSS
jgi:hypothetical protein